MKAVIERGADGGFAIYTNDAQGVYGSGMTEQEAKTCFEEVMVEQAKYHMEQTGKYPDWYSDNIAVEYVYDISGFFEQFPFINATAFAKEIGLNAAMMRKYKRKLVPVSDKQKAIIQNKYNELVNRMQAVVF
ncbi:MAG: type II toxin-antitoxin system HicB family antitoxin [Salinivirgaceae bacterium]|nr:type II toxin-antitoxin system HicB family antitoxin [Salinivirgaceae bacterium]